ncbi:HPr family phosphocarrier protein [Desulfogranum japonicum]|uniref:HPr family phosphocarrier protein n=1 Tax=Desulfogranum japonicum TaxID=231447 RepID=UPI00041F81D4|nr:HPr family phosphocarrier protein [Desulfogranum japonicum]
METHRTILVANQQGVHGRVATMLAKIAVAYDGEVLLQYKNEIVSCCSILDVLSLGLTQGSEIKVTAHGEKAEETLDKISQILTSATDPQPDN